jgi:hypothetical protein
VSDDNRKESCNFFIVIVINAGHCVGNDNDI